MADRGWNATAPADTGMTVQVRTSLDNVTWDNWSTVSTAAGSTFPTLGRYAQYQLEFHHQQHGGLCTTRFNHAYTWRGSAANTNQYTNRDGDEYTTATDQYAGAADSNEYA